MSSLYDWQHCKTNNCQIWLYLSNIIMHDIHNHTCQALSILSQIQGCTYEREDIGERRLGSIADEVESAIDQLAIDNVIGSKWHRGQDYKTLDYSRLISLVIPALNTLAKRVEFLESIITGSNS